MYLNTNISAMQAIQSLFNTTTEENQTLDQLSTGNRITSAASDPAGLAISELMQSQINGLNQASQNAQNGISLLQTADGAMNNIDTILQSMRSLASEAATGTNNANDLQDLQKEMNQYAKEITNIANTTQFNDINLLDGGFQNQAIQVGAEQGQALGISIGSLDAVSLGVAGYSASVSTNTAYVDPASLSLGAGLTSGASYAISAGIQQAGVATLSSGALVSAASDIAGTYTGALTTTYTISLATNSVGSYVYTIQGSDGYSSQTVSATELTSLTISDATAGANLTVTVSTAAAAGDTQSFTMDPAQISYQLESGSGTTIGSATTFMVADLSGVTVEIGDTNSGQDATGQVVQFSVNTSAVSALYSVASSVTTTAGTTDFTVNVAGTTANLIPGVLSLSTQDYATVQTGLNISTQASAQVALTTLNNAIQQVNNQRANIGAIMNRLSFAENNAQTASTNLQAANAGYMDANMPADTAQFMQEQVLTQADVGLLAQAEQLPSFLLKLIP